MTKSQNKCLGYRLFLLCDVNKTLYRKPFMFSWFVEISDIFLQLSHLAAVAGTVVWENLIKYYVYEKLWLLRNVQGLNVDV